MNTTPELIQKFNQQAATLLASLERLRKAIDLIEQKESSVPRLSLIA